MPQESILAYKDYKKNTSKNVEYEAKTLKERSYGIKHLGFCAKKNKN